jgi:hypothetical protein
MNFGKRFASSLIFKAALLAGLAGNLWGQAQAAASRSAAISVFGGGSFVRPDSGSSSQSGYMFGTDYTYYPGRFYLVPSLELRGSISPKGKVVGENVFGGGLRVEHRYSRFSPYADLLVGAGTLKFTTPIPLVQGGLYESNNSIVYTYGGGVDIGVFSHLSVKVDVQGSHWNLNPNNPTILQPLWMGVGLVYRIPFGSR